MTSTVAIIMGPVFLAGIIVGAVLTASLATAAMHRSQARMQRKVRHWQARWRRAHRCTRRASF
ncbi:MAG: hypothetical protein ACM3ML_25620 [Micromonosporaceae bacterium]